MFKNMGTEDSVDERNKNKDFVLPFEFLNEQRSFFGFGREIFSADNDNWIVKWKEIDRENEGGEACNVYIIIGKCRFFMQEPRERSRHSNLPRNQRLQFRLQSSLANVSLYCCLHQPQNCQLCCHFLSLSVLDSLIFLFFVFSKSFSGFS